VFVLVTLGFLVVVRDQLATGPGSTPPVAPGLYHSLPPGPPTRSPTEALALLAVSGAVLGGPVAAFTATYPVLPIRLEGVLVALTLAPVNTIHTPRVVQVGITPVAASGTATTWPNRATARRVAAHFQPRDAQYHAELQASPLGAYTSLGLGFGVQQVAPDLPGAFGQYALACGPRFCRLSIAGLPAPPV
jgi:hypothetical protein